VLTRDLSFDKHVTAVSANCFFQLRRTRRSLDEDSTAILSSTRSSLAGLDYCNGLLITVIDKLPRVLNAAAQSVSNTGKYDQGLYENER